MSGEGETIGVPLSSKLNAVIFRVQSEFGTIYTPTACRVQHFEYQLWRAVHWVRRFVRISTDKYG